MSDDQIESNAGLTPADGVLAIDRLDHGVVLVRLNLPKRRNAMTARPWPSYAPTVTCGWSS